MGGRNPPSRSAGAAQAIRGCLIVGGESRAHLSVDLLPPKRYHDGSPRQPRPPSGGRYGGFRRVHQGGRNFAVRVFRGEELSGRNSRGKPQRGKRRGEGPRGQEPHTTISERAFRLFIWGITHFIWVGLDCTRSRSDRSHIAESCLSRNSRSHLCTAAIRCNFHRSHCLNRVRNLGLWKNPSDVRKSRAPS